MNISLERRDAFLQVVAAFANFHLLSPGRYGTK